MVFPPGESHCDRRSLWREVIWIRDVLAKAIQGVVRIDQIVAAWMRACKHFREPGRKRKMQMDKVQVS